MSRAPATTSGMARSTSSATTCAPISTESRCATSSTGQGVIERQRPGETNGGRDEPMPDSPVQSISAEEDRREPEPGMALCLSGGGYRAMVFHLGALWRLYEAGLLGGVKRI